MMKCKLIVFDEVNCAFEGLLEKHINKIIRETKLPVKGGFLTAEYRLKLSDGKESNFYENGYTYVYMLETIIPMIVDFGYEVEIEDHRESLKNTYEYISNDFLSGYGIDLYEHQVKAVNSVIDNHSGIAEISTSGGKTLISATIVKLFEREMDFVTIVPTEKLVIQTYEQYKEIGLDVGCLKKGMTKKQKDEAWSKKHIVATYKIINNNRSKIGRFGGFIYDECHIMGDVMYRVLTHELSNAKIRVGMTATLPKKDPFKKQKIKCHIGGDVLIKVKPKELQQKGHISTCDIEMIEMEHQFKFIGEWNWKLEEDYLFKNKTRLDKIINRIEELDKVNTLVLCHKKQAEYIAKQLNTDFITGDIKEKERESYYQKFKENDDYVLVATYDTIGTGVSINEIFQLVMIDVGKNDIRIIQGIGRGLRKDGKENHLKIYDIYSKLYFWNNRTSRWKLFCYSSKHYRERKRHYDELGYPYVEKEKIKVA